MSRTRDRCSRSSGPMRGGGSWWAVTRAHWKELGLAECFDGNAGELLRQPPAFVGRRGLAPARESHRADAPDQRAVLDARNARHAREAGVRCDVGIRVDFQDPWLAVRVDAHVHAAIAAAAHELPGAERDAAHLV